MLRVDALRNSRRVGRADRLVHLLRAFLRRVARRLVQPGCAPQAACTASATKTRPSASQVIVSAGRACCPRSPTHRNRRPQERRRCLLARRGRQRRFRQRRRVPPGLGGWPFSNLPVQLLYAIRPVPPAPHRAGAGSSPSTPRLGRCRPARLPESARTTTGPGRRGGSGQQSTERTRPDRRKAGGDKATLRHSAPRPTPTVSDPRIRNTPGLPARFTRPPRAIPPFFRRRT